MSRPSTEEDAQRLRQFKRRADSVLGCSLAQEDEAPILGRRLRIRLVDGKLESLKATLPDKESVATALTLLRPITLEREDIFHAKVMGALSRLSTDESLTQALRDTKKFWKGYPSATVQMMRGMVGVPEPEVSTWNNELAQAWVYGELVHADDHSALLDALGEEFILFSAGAMASEGFALVSNTLWLMHQIRPDIQPEPPAYGERHGPGQAGAPAEPTT